MRLRAGLFELRQIADEGVLEDAHTAVVRLGRVVVTKNRAVRFVYVEQRPLFGVRVRAEHVRLF